MNPAPQNHPATPPAFSAESSHPTPFAHRGNGKVARLPKSVRQQINEWMLDGVSYPDIIQRLGQDGIDLNPGHLCEWRKRGYQDWLLEQAWLAQTRARQEPAADLSADFDATQLNHAALQLGTLHIFEALRDLHPSADNAGSPSSPGTQAESAPQDSRPSAKLSDSTASALEPQPAADQNSRTTPQKSPRPKSQLDLRLGGDSSAFVRLINALARASRETMLVQKYREACARARAALTELKDPERKLNEKETRAIVRKVDEILGFCSPEDDESDLADAGGSQSTVEHGSQRESDHHSTGEPHGMSNGSQPPPPCAIGPEGTIGESLSGCPPNESPQSATAA